MLRLADLFAILALAVVLLLPKASIDARPALAGEPLELDRIARLQDDAFRDPHDVDALVQLADGFLSFGRADWAIASLSRFTAAETAGEPWAAAPVARARVHLVAATARAERLETGPCVEEARRAEESCQAAADAPACIPLLARVELIRAAMQTLLDQGIDPTTDPQRAKTAVSKALHTSRAGY